MQFCELSKEEYATFQKTHPYRNFLNSIEMVEHEKAEGYECCIVGVKEGKEVLCAGALVKMPTMKKFSFYYAPRGFLVDYENTEVLTYFMKELKRYAKQKGAVYVLFDPYILYQERDQDGNVVEGGFNNQFVVDALEKVGCRHKGFPVGYGHNMQWIRFMYSMSLKDTTKEALWKSLHQQTRWSINKTLKYKMQVKELSYEELSVFDDIMQKTGERRQFDSRDLSFYERQYKAYGEHLKVLLAYMDIPLYQKVILEERQKEEEERVMILKELEKVPGSKKYTKKLKVVEEALDIADKRMEESETLRKQYGDSIPMAASMFMKYGDEVTYLTSGAYEEFRGFYAPYAIQWHMICEALEEGYHKYNFYGISGEFNEDSPNYGVYKFKRGFPGCVEELVGDFVLPVRKGLFALYEMKQKIR